MNDLAPVLPLIVLFFQGVMIRMDCLGSRPGYLQYEHYVMWLSTLHTSPQIDNTDTQRTTTRYNTTQSNPHPHLEVNVPTAPADI